MDYLYNAFYSFMIILYLYENNRTKNALPLVYFLMRWYLQYEKSFSNVK